MKKNIEYLERAASLLHIPAICLSTNQKRCFELIDYAEEENPSEAADARDLMTRYWLGE